MTALASGWRRLGLALVLVAGAVGFVGADRQPAQAATAAPAVSASRLDGVEIVYGSSGPTDASSPKTATASCPGGKEVLGGGAFISRAYGLSSPAFTLTQLEPYTPGRNPHDPLGRGYWVSAATTASMSPGNWHLSAYAVCADPWPGLHVVSHYTDYSSDALQATLVACPEGEHVLGTGARIIPKNTGSAYQHGIGLQVARTDALGVLTRAQAHERPGGYADEWRLKAIAVCAPTMPQGWMVATAASPDQDTDSKQAIGDCPPLYVHGFPNQWLVRRPISMGAATSNVAPGNVTLHEVYPFGDEAWAGAWENTPTDEDWDLIVVRYICAVAPD